MRKCEACKENIKKTDRIVRTNDDGIYHEECCNICSNRYTVYSDGFFVGETENKAMDAWMLLDEDE